MTDPVFQPKGITPTAEQLAIQLGKYRRVIVEANAGAAKTTTLALRMAQALARGADPRQLLALTYTAEAVGALKLTLERMGLPATTRHALRIQTFDDFSAACLHEIEGSKVPLLAHDEQLKPYVLRAIERVLDNPDERHREAFAVEGSGEGMVEGLLDTFRRLKGTMQLTLEASDRTPSPALAEELEMDYLSLRAYWACEHLRRGGHPDHHAFRAPNDATYDLARLLLDEEAWHGLPQPLELGLHLILIDEMHDTNRAMFTVLKGLLRHNPQAVLVGVGDRDQVIHAVAGADAAFMGHAFDTEIGPAQRLPLSATYRFGPALARAAGLLAHKPYASASPRATELRLVHVSSAREASREIVRMVEAGEGLGPKGHVGDIAVLLHHPHQSVDLENHLLDKGVAYRATGFESYLMRPEVLFVRGLMAYAHQTFADIEHADTRLRILRALLLFAGSFVESERETAEERLSDQEGALAQLAKEPSGQALAFFMDNQILRNAREDARALMLDAIEVLRANQRDAWLGHFTEALQPQRLAARVMVRAEDIEQVSANIKGLVASADTYDDLHAFFRAMNAREVRLRGMRGKHCLVLSSIEAAKGLEFEHVIMPGLNRGEFATGHRHREADHRNMLYVGMTRARQRLSLLFDPTRPSAFLKDAGLI